MQLSKRKQKEIIQHLNTAHDLATDTAIKSEILEAIILVGGTQLSLRNGSDPDKHAAMTEKTLPLHIAASVVRHTAQNNLLR